MTQSCRVARTKRQSFNKIYFILLIISFISNLAMAEDGADLMSMKKSMTTDANKKYIEALINLKSVEHFFTGQPIYLNKDKFLKHNLTIKLQMIIDGINERNKISPNNAETLFVLGKAYSYAHDLDIPGSWKKSVECLNKSIILDSNNINSYIIQGKNYMDNLDYGKAMEEYVAANNLQPHGQALKFLAIVKIRLNKMNEAKSDLKEYLKYHSDDEYAKKMYNAIESGKIAYD